jgi:hypothetical protein
LAIVSGAKPRPLLAGKALNLVHLQILAAQIAHLFVHDPLAAFANLDQQPADRVPANVAQHARVRGCLPSSTHIRSNGRLEKAASL